MASSFFLVFLPVNWADNLRHCPVAGAGAEQVANGGELGFGRARAVARRGR